MTSVRFLIGLLLIASVAVAQHAGAQPFVVDDTGLAPARSLQVEVWHHVHASWLVPSAQVIPGLDIISGVGLLRNGSDGAGQLAIDLQSKWQFRGPERAWGVAVVGGATAMADALLDSESGSVYAYVPLNITLLGGRFVLYPNAGWTYARGGLHEFTWGLRADGRLMRRLALVAETYGAGSAAPGYQVGVQVWPGSERLELDLTLSRAERNGSRHTWVTVGAIVVIPVAW